MPCTAPARGKTDTQYPWCDPIQSDPCGLPTLTGVGGVDVSGQNLCSLHYAMKYGALPQAAAADPATVLLLHGETLVDEKGHPITAVGNAAVGTAQSKFGGSSLAFGGGGDRLSLPDSPDWWFGTSDFTIDFWARWAAVSDCYLMGQWPGAPNYSWFIRHNGMQFFMAVSDDGTTQFFGSQAAHVPTVGTWYHFAVVREGSLTTSPRKYYVNGVQAGQSAMQISSYFDSSTPLLIGSGFGGSLPFNGNLDEVRISKVARWTANFTPPTAPYS